MMGKCITYMLLGGLAFFSLPSFAQKHWVEGAVGIAGISDVNYDDAGAAYASYSYHTNPVYFSISNVYVDEFVSGDISVSVLATSLSLGHKLNLGSFIVGGDVGLANIDTQAYFKDINIGSSTNISASAQIRVVKKLNKLLGLRAGVMYLNDVSEQSLLMVNAGMRFTF